MDSQFAANPITNITNITNVMSSTEHFSQINQQTNDNLFTSTDNDNDICTLFDGFDTVDFNFTL